MSNLKHFYVNGNYIVSIYEDGTKIRETTDDFFRPKFPESCDVKITNFCDLGSDARNECAFCHEKSNLKGVHGDLDFVANAWNGLPGGVELAVGGGNPLSHPEFSGFAKHMTKSRFIINLTMNQIHLAQKRYVDMARKLVSDGDICGLGISARINSENDIDNLISLSNEFSNSVIHVIAGLDDFESILSFCRRANNPKILVLGYKIFGNGRPFYKGNKNNINKNKLTWKNRLAELINISSSKGGVISFDNLAISQLNVRRLLSKEQWNIFYQGYDGSFTFYLDAVTKTFAKSSTSVERYQALSSAKDMFNGIKMI